MNVMTKDVSFEDGITKVKGLDAVIYYMSDTVAEKNYSGEVLWDQCLEARFFNEFEEYHFYCEDSGWKVIHVSENDDTSDCKCIKRKYPLRRSKYGKGSVTVCEYLKPDEDGQMCVFLTRLERIDKEGNR